MNQEVQTIEHEGKLPAPNGEPSLLEVITRLASDSSVDISRLKEIMELRRSIVADEARRAYVESFAAMQENLPIIGERGKIEKRSTYALWEDVNEAIKPVLSKYGFTLDFETEQDDKSITITGFLSHTGGHTKQTKLRLPFDASGGKNPVQAIASSMSYGKRYTAGALLNLTSRGEDDDGKAAGKGKTIAEDQVISLREGLEGIAQTGGSDGKPFDTKATIQRFCDALQVESLADIPASRLQEAKDLLAQGKGAVDERAVAPPSRHVREAPRQAVG